MPTDPETQERLRLSILDAAFDRWMAKKGLTFDLEEQWEAFVRKARANGYTYLDWRSAFQNWLTSEYQQPRRASPAAANPLDGVLSPKGQRSFANAQRIMEEMAHDGRSIFTTLLSSPQHHG